MPFAIEVVVASRSPANASRAVSASSSELCFVQRSASESLAFECRHDYVRVSVDGLLESEIRDLFGGVAATGRGSAVKVHVL